MKEKLKELTKDTAVYGISNIVGRFFNFLLVPFYTNVFTKAEYGIAFYIYSFVAFLNIVYIYGMDAAFMKYTSLAENSEEKKDTFSTPFLFVFFSSSIATILFLIFKPQIADLINITSEYSFLIYYVTFILLLDTLALIPFADLRMQRKARKFALIKIINIFINLTLNIVLIKFYNYGIEGMFLSNLIASAFSLTALLPEIFNKLKIRISKETLKKMINFGIPYLPASIAAMMVQMIDVPILRELTDDATVGVYRANYKLGIFMMLFVSMFQYAWQPFFLTNAKEKNAKEMFSKVFTLTTIVMAVVWLLISLFISDLAKIEILPGKFIIGKDFWGGLIIVPIVLLGYLFYGMYINFTAGIYIEEKTKYFPYVTGAGAAANIIVNLFLIPVYGIMGAAVATLISYLVMAAGLFLVSQKFYKINYEYGKIFSILFLIILVGVIYYYLQFENQMIFFYKILLLTGFIVLLFVFRVIKKSEVESTIKLFLKKN